MDLRRKETNGEIRRGAEVESGGSDGCVNFNDADNAGLAGCLAWTGISKIYDQWCDKISLADFMVVAGEAMAGALAVNYDPADPFKSGTLLWGFQSQFGYGRETVETCPANHGLMPNPENGCDDLRKVF